VSVDATGGCPAGAVGAAACAFPALALTFLEACSLPGLSEAPPAVWPLDSGLVFATAVSAVMEMEQRKRVQRPDRHVDKSFRTAHHVPPPGLAAVQTIITSAPNFVCIDHAGSAGRT